MQIERCDKSMDVMGAPEVRLAVVLGMHRSGTSAATFALSNLGFGLPKTLMKPQRDNPRGFAESVPLFRLNEALLKRVGMTWKDFRPIDPRTFTGPGWVPLRMRAHQLLTSEIGSSGTLVYKDPRLCRLMPFWVPVLDRLEARFVFVVRNPLSVAESLRVRNGIPLQTAVRIWAAHVFGALIPLGNRPVFFLAYDDLMVRRDESLRRAAVAVGRDPSAVDRLPEDIGLTTELQHHRFTSADVDRSRELPSLVRRLYRTVIEPAVEGRFLRHRLLHLYDEWLLEQAPTRDRCTRRSQGVIRRAPTRNLAGHRRAKGTDK